MDIGDADIDVDESVELMDPSALGDKMVLMPVGEANQNQEDISEFCNDAFYYAQSPSKVLEPQVTILYFWHTNETFVFRDSKTNIV